MKVLIERKWKKATYTIGRVYVDGVFVCNSLEDTDRGLRQDMNVGEIANLKVYGKTAIPSGKYKVLTTYSAKYKKKMPQVMNVKGFSGIRIHAGNTADDSLGCILLGRNTAVGRLTESRKCTDAFYKMLADAGGECELEIG